MSYTVVSIIIPAYNCEKYIADAINSCINQNYSNIEIIVVNDGSTDSTKEIVEEFLVDPRVKLINQENQGVSTARNVGINNSSGKYITFLDSDDTLAPDTIRKNIDLFSLYPDVAWLFFPIQRIDMNGNAVDRIANNMLPSFKYEKISIISAEEAFLQMNLHNFPACIWGAFFRQDFIDIKFKQGRFEDTIMLMELLRKREHILLSPYGAYNYYDRANSFINKEWTADKWESYVNVNVAIMQTELELFPSRKEIIEKRKSEFYYTLRYLKAKYRNDSDFAKPLTHYLKLVGNTKFSFKGWFKFVTKSALINCLGILQKH